MVVLLLEIPGSVVILRAELWNFIIVPMLVVEH